ncbi:HAMP domain-containing sensor histidine kinase [Corynebacterium sp. 21KM1197]|nr:HAMP domain-containing sensor histidine kinase [Corynebacterium sp. 21KM1197]WPF68286.1 HAMP domain-containing sensor histidine kinase [Corynebacterium sp. 21KM1197]
MLKQSHPEQWGTSTPQRRPYSPLRSIPLRVWLVMLVVAVAGVGLLGSSTAVSAVMRGYSLDKVDEELESVLNGFTSSAGAAANAAPSEGAVIRRVPLDFYVQVIYPDGTPAGENSWLQSTPDISSLNVDAGPQTLPASAESSSNQRWRATAKSQDGVVVVVAKSLAREETLIGRLRAVQTIISLTVLVVIAMVAHYLVYRSLKPLREVERTAGDIAEGNLDRRLPQWPMNTEVGQLAYALNVMLGRLQRSIEESRDKEEQMRRFVGDASHELRTPLTSLRGYTELYRSGATTDIDLVLGKVDAESKRMSLLVEDLLALTRAEGQRLNSETVDLLELCLSVAGTARAAFPGRTVMVDNKTSAVPLVVGDASRLHQVLLNLLTNALRHGGERATATIRLTFDGAQDSQVRIQVIDDGVGMSPDNAAHIFERFYRADTSRSRASGGSGLGLAITKSLVEKHGGTIEVESEVGVGSTFTITLERKPEPEDPHRDSA